MRKYEIAYLAFIAPATVAGDNSSNGFEKKPN